MRLRLLGGLSIEASGDADPEALLSQPKRVALLVYLALAERRTRSRDLVLAQFWPDSDTERARNALNQSVHVIRTFLGPGSIVTRGTEIGVGAEVECDAPMLLDAHHAGRFEVVVDLYRGDLLPGFFVEGLSDFERWLDQTRQECRRLASDAAWQLAARCAQDGDKLQAARWAKRSVELAGVEELAARRGLEFLGSLGDHAGTLATYERFRRTLWDKLETEPTAATQEVVASGTKREYEAAPRDGPRDVPREKPVVVGDVPSPSRSPSRHVHLGRPAPWLPRLRLVAGAMALVLLALPALVVGPKVAAIDAVRLRIETPTVAGLASAGALGSGLESRITELLAGPGRIAVVDSGHAGEDDVVSLASRIVQLGDTLHVGVFLHASGGRLIVAKTLHMPSDADHGSIVNAIASAAASWARKQVGLVYADEHMATGAPTPEALSTLRAGYRYRVTGDSLRRDGRRDAALGAYNAGRISLRRLVRRHRSWEAPTLELARIESGVGWTHLTVGRGDRHGARNAFLAGVDFADQAAELSARKADALALAGRLLYMAAALSDGAIAEEHLKRAEARLRRAVELEPASPRAWATLSALYESRGNFGEAYWAAGEAQVADVFMEHSLEITNRLFNAALETRRTEEAGRWCRELGMQFRSTTAPLHCELALAADPVGGSPDDRLDARAIRALAERADSLRAPREVRAHLIAKAAVALVRAGHAAGAADLIARAESLAGDTDEFVRMQAEFLQATGDVGAAADHLRRYVALDPQRHLRAMKTSTLQGAANYLRSTADASPPE